MTPETPGPPLRAVIDVHQHVGDSMATTHTVAELANVSIGLDTSEVERMHRLSFMDATGIGQAIVIPGHKYLRPNGLADTRSVNDAIAAYAARDPDRFPAALGVVEPRDGPFALPELDRMRSELGLAGVSLHCRFQGVSLDNGWIRQYVARMADLGLIPFVHVVHETPDEALWKLCQLADAFPSVTFVALDAFGSFDGARHCLYAAETHDNIMFDTALAFQWSVVEGFVLRFGSTRVIFGTDTYSYQPMPNVLAELLASELPEADKAAMLSGNVRRLLNLAGATVHWP